MSNKKEDTFFSLIFLTIITSTLVILTTNCHHQSTTPPKPHYINQSEYDSVLHGTFQERYLNLKLIHNKPSQFKDLRFNINTSWDEEKTHSYQFDKAGKFEKKIAYKESRIDIYIPGEILPTNNAIDSICYLWFHPNQWFESLDLEILTDSLQATYVTDSLGKFTLTITYPPYLKPIEANISFDRSLGVEIDLLGKYKEYQKYYKIQEQSEGKIVLLIEAPYFLKKHTARYPERYQEGDYYPLAAYLVLAPPQGLFHHKRSSKKDRPYKPKLYASGYTSRGTPYATIGSSTPSYNIRIDISKKIILTKAHF